jgi:hypothetical protein
MFIILNHCPWTMLILVICSSSYAIKSTMYSNNEWYVCKLLTNYVLKRICSKGVSADKYFEICDFFRESTNIETYGCTIYPCLCLTKGWYTCHLNKNMIDTEKYQSVLQNMKIVIRSLRSLANKLHIVAQQANIFGINQFTFR